MATSPKSNPIRTTGNTWVALATGKQAITSVGVTPAGGTATVSLMLRRGGVDYMIQGPRSVTESSRIWTDEIALETGDTLMARSDAQADWITSGYVEV
ncbi:hypothetical protein IMZ29_00715 [Achromobacter sp. GG226]|uniref:hypothetical protein n=1 Tax=Verticiella alkaliphila TaxID=2779529 RepID=UPI001C0C33C4|nr:hypothetical protein [Verticiella sp. GG226]MBU4609124.1 hypothetical protein [Verticiella sp. GG226]